MPGRSVSFVGDAMAAVVQAIDEVRGLIGVPPVVVGGVAVMCRLSTPYRATDDLDVLEVRQIELDEPSDDPGDRLHASAHAWANDTATEVTITVVRMDGEPVEVTTKVSEPGPLIAMKIQAVMNRSVDKQGTDLRDIVRLTLDPETRPTALNQIGAVDDANRREPSAGSRTAGVSETATKV